MKEFGLIVNMNKVYLKEHLKKYPLMGIEDIIKLHLQGILGPAHLLPSKDKIKENFIKEYNEIKDLDLCVIGANLYNIHSTMESVEIESIKRVYNWLVKTLETME